MKYQVFIHPNNQPTINCGVIEAKNEAALNRVMKKDWQCLPADFSFEKLSRKQISKLENDARILTSIQSKLTPEEVEFLKKHLLQ